MIYQLILVADVLLFGAVVAWYLKAVNAPLFNPIGYYLLFHFIVFVYRPILSYYYGFTVIYSVYGFQPDWDVKQTALLTTDLALLTFCAVCAWRTAGVPLSIRAPENREREAQLLPYVLMCVICAPVGLYALVTSFSTKSAASSTMVNDAATGFAVNTTGVGYLSDTQLMMGPIVVLLIWLCRFRWWSFVPLGAYLVLKSGTGGRWPVVMACLSLGLFYIIDRKGQRFPFKLLIALVPLYLGFQAIGNDRGQFIRSQFQTQVQLVEQDTVQLKPMESMDWGNLEFLEYLVWVIPNRSGTYSYFLDNLQIFTEPVPRVLWPGKPIGPPIKRFSLFDYGTPLGMTQSVPGAGWAAMGWLGVAIWAGLFGIVMGSIYVAYARSRQSLFLTAAFVIFLPMTLTQFRDGSLITILKQSLFTMLPIVVWCGLSHYFASAPRVVKDESPIGLAPRQRDGAVSAASVASATPAGGESGTSARDRQPTLQRTGGEGDRLLRRPRERQPAPLRPRAR